MLEHWQWDDHFIIVFYEADEEVAGFHLFEYTRFKQPILYMWLKQLLGF